MSLVEFFFFSRSADRKRPYSSCPAAVPDYLRRGRLPTIASGVLSGMDLSGQTLLQDIRVSPSHVRMVICQDFVRVGESIRIGAQVGSRGKIMLKTPEFDWPDREAYRYHEHSLQRGPIRDREQTTRGGKGESPRAANTA
ncbi:MAG TPA: hypothetical protein VGX26_09080 [Solirubrobacteraceae bacterium]|jgi:hypothetical protein|nr:hypothetical protein [Solirubrobacteraceae bacterium]